MLLLLLSYRREDITVTITTLKRRVKCSYRVRTLHVVLLYYVIRVESQTIYRGTNYITRCIMCAIKIGVGTYFPPVFNTGKTTLYI